MDFTLLNHDQFELLVGRLLQAEGLGLVAVSRVGRDVGIDFIAENPSKTVVEVMHRPSRIVFRSETLSKVQNLINAAALLNADHYLLVISGEFDLKARDRVAREFPSLQIWDGDHVQSLLDKYPNVANEFAVLSSHTEAIRRRITPPKLNPRASDLIARLHQLPSGRNYFRNYEDLCVEILNHLFVPPLGVPAMQTISEDGLDRRDAVYQVSSGTNFWGTLRSEFHTRFVVAEFKNYSTELGQKEIESIQQYLFDMAMRRFGLLCGRQQASENGLRARRRAWTENQKMIVILNDGDLEEMIRIKANDGEPSILIDQQINDFFRDLAP